MNQQEELFYDCIHQRCSVNEVLKSMHKLKKINAISFIEQISIAENINPYYVKTILKSILDNVSVLNEEGTASQDQIAVISSGDVYLIEWLYEKYIELLNVPAPAPTDKDIVQYTLNPDLKIKIEEIPRVISGAGTTGFRTWEASLYLSEYLLNYDFVNKSVLELGAGTSMVSATIAKIAYDKINKLYVTDGDSTILETISLKNFRLNGLDNDEKLVFRRLMWNQDPVPEDLNLVVAADVTYDSSVVPDLCRCLLQCLTSRQCTHCLVSATIRNEDTIKGFQDELTSLKMKYRIVSTTESHDNDILKITTLKKDLIAPIRIYNIEYPRV